MKIKILKVFLSFALLLIVPSIVFSDGNMARGVLPGELYVYGVGGVYPAAPRWLYRSTDYGQTVSFQSETGVGLFGEGATESEVYKYAGVKIYYSDDYGVSFTVKSTVGSELDAIASGYTPGELYAYISHVMKYSTDYGETFIDKGTCPGWVASMSVGHSAGEIYCGCNNGEVYLSTDYGETYELIIDIGGGYDIYNLSKGNDPGELYILANYMTLFYSKDYGDTLSQQYDFDEDVQFGLARGFSTGEVYVMEDIYDMFGKEDLYIHRSLDYGETFSTYHVYSNHMDVLLPEKITDLESFKNSSFITLIWPPVHWDIWGNWEWIDHYVVYRSTDPYFIPTSDDSVGSPVDTTFTDLESDSASAYFYVVTAVDTAGNMSKPSHKVGKMSSSLVSY
jgi:hypothetical protein